MYLVHNTNKGTSIDTIHKGEVHTIFLCDRIYCGPHYWLVQGTKSQMPISARIVYHDQCSNLKPLHGQDYHTAWSVPSLVFKQFGFQTVEKSQILKIGNKIMISFSLVQGFTKSYQTHLNEFTFDFLLLICNIDQHLAILQLPMLVFFGSLEETQMQDIFLKLL